jgi:hypothetical protein
MERTMTLDSEHLMWVKNRLISLDIPANEFTDYIIRLNKIIHKTEVKEQEEKEKATMEIFAKAHAAVEKTSDFSSLGSFEKTVHTTSYGEKVTADYESLSDVLDSAYEQASEGKGKERHAGNGLSFLDQPMQTISKLLNTSDGLSFQVCKKVTEAKSMETLAQKERELLGAIVYTAGIIIYEQNKAKKAGE